MSDLRIWPSTEPREGYVYLIAPQGHNVYKIGCTVNLESRLARIQRKHALKLGYVAVVHSQDYTALEDALHRLFSAYRLDGEWFVLSPDQINYIKGLAS